MSRNDNNTPVSQNAKPLIELEKKPEPNQSKRRLLKGAIGSTPIIMAATSKPVLAAWCSVSGFLSGNLSNHHGQDHCGGRSPGYWMSKHGIPLDDRTTFRSVFGGVWEDGYGVKWEIKYDGGGHEIGPLFREVCAMDGNDDHYQFGSHAVAAYMNAITYTGSYMPVTQVVQIVGEVLAFGYYTDPTTGQTLNAERVVDFIQQTFD